MPPRSAHQSEIPTPDRSLEVPFYSLPAVGVSIRRAARAIPYCNNVSARVGRALESATTTEITLSPSPHPFEPSITRDRQSSWIIIRVANSTFPPAPAWHFLISHSTLLFETQVQITRPPRESLRILSKRSGFATNTHADQSRATLREQKIPIIALYRSFMPTDDDEEVTRHSRRGNLRRRDQYARTSATVSCKRYVSKKYQS